MVRTVENLVGGAPFPLTGIVVPDSGSGRRRKASGARRLREALRELDPAWRDDELSIAGDLTQYAKVRIMEISRSIHHARQKGQKPDPTLRVEQHDRVRNLSTIGALFDEIYAEHHPIPKKHD